MGKNDEEDDKASENEAETSPETPEEGGGGTAWRLTKMMVDAFQSKDEKYAGVLEKKDEAMAEANSEALASKDRTIRMLWISLMLCIILLGVVAGAIGTGTLKIAGLGEIGLGDGDGESTAEPAEIDTEADESSDDAPVEP